MTELDLLCNFHKAYENEISYQPDAARISDYHSKYQRARSAYLECTRTYNVHEMHYYKLQMRTLTCGELTRYSQ